MDYTLTPDPFGFPLLTYLWVLGLGLVSGLIRNLNKGHQFSISKMIIDACTSAFTSLIAFWYCLSQDITGHMLPVYVCAAGWLGTGAWSSLEDLLRTRLGLTHKTNGDLHECKPNQDEQRSSETAN